MSIALSGVVLLLLFLPGIIFRRFYYTEEFSKQYFKSTVGDLLSSVFIPCLIIHLLTLWCFVYPDKQIDFVVLGSLLSGNNSDASVHMAFESLDRNKTDIIKYFLGSGFLAVILGIITKLVVRNTKIDRKFKLFRFQNEWHYLFSGEIFDFPRVEGAFDDIDLIFVDALVETNDGPLLYMGILAEYILSKDGGIDRIYLTDVTRRKLADDRKNEDPYELPGEFFVIPFNKISNLHINYYSVDLTDSLIDKISIAHPEDADALGDED